VNIIDNNEQKFSLSLPHYIFCLMKYEKEIQSDPIFTLKIVRFLNFPLFKFYKPIEYIHVRWSTHIISRIFHGLYYSTRRWKWPWFKNPENYLFPLCNLCRKMHYSMTRETLKISSPSTCTCDCLIHIMLFFRGGISDIQSSRNPWIF
jgi:hypothetical protein